MFFRRDTTLLATLVAATLLANCGGSSFKGGSGVARKAKAPQSNTGLPHSDPLTTPEAVPPKLELNYNTCATRPENGRRSTGKCNANEVIVIVNDGTAGEMTCCPVGTDVLSAVEAEQNIRKQGKCGPDEVATGVEDLRNSVVLCTKVNTQFLKTEPRASAVYAKSGTPGILGTLAQAYNIGDCCVCGEGSVFIGNHTSSDNTCSDECVAIVKK